jgi:integrase
MLRGHLAGWYLSHAARAGLADSTKSKYENFLNSHLVPELGDLTLDEVTVAVLDAYRDRKLQAGLAPATVNGTLVLLGATLDVAEERGLITRNVLRINPRNRRAKVPHPDHRWLRDARELRALLDAAGELDTAAREDRRHVARRAIVATLALAGLRISELCALVWADVDLAAGRINVRASKTHAGVRDVELVGRLRDELAAWKARAPFAAPGDYVFATATATGRRSRTSATASWPRSRRAPPSSSPASPPTCVPTTCAGRRSRCGWPSAGTSRG